MNKKTIYRGFIGINAVSFLMFMFMSLIIFQPTKADGGCPCGPCFPSPTLTVNVNPNVGGDVRVNGYIQTFASEDYGSGPMILEALAAEGYEFDRWAGSIDGSDNPTSIVFYTNKTVTAYFQALPDRDNDGYNEDEDCDDHDRTIHPDATEICDGKDNDCDGSMDEGCPISRPSSLEVKAKSSTQIILGWKDNSTIEDGYKIEKKTGGCSSTENWKEIDAESENETTYTLSRLSPNTIYAFRVRAHKSYSRYSDYSDCASAKTAASGTPPSPTNLKATSVSSTNVKLTWSDNSTNETGFKVYGKAGAGVWTLLKTTEGNVKNFSDTAATNNSSTITYQYYVVAFNESGNSPSTNAAATPYQPLNLKATKGSASGSLILTWSDKSSNESGFELERKSGNCASTATWAKVATLGANKTTWTDKWLASGSNYAYRIRAYKKSGLILSTYGYSMWTPCKSSVAP